MRPQFAHGLRDALLATTCLVLTGRIAPTAWAGPTGRTVVGGTAATHRGMRGGLPRSVRDALLTVAIMIVQTVCASVVWGAPSDPTVVRGKAVITDPNANTIVID